MRLGDPPNLGFPVGARVVDGVSGSSGTHSNLAGMTSFYVPVLTDALGDVVRSRTEPGGVPLPPRGR